MLTDFLFLSQLEKRLRDSQDSHDKEENALRVQISKLQQEKRQLQDTLAQYQTNEQKQKQEFDQVLYRAQEMQEMLERETQEKFASMAEQKSLRQQVENLSKNMKSLQVSIHGSWSNDGIMGSLAFTLGSPLHVAGIKI